MEMMGDEKNNSTYEQVVIDKKKIEEKKVYTFLKRLLDISGSLVGLICLSPVFLVVSLLIKFENRKGTVFFSQTRVGKDNKQFKIYKFRSMVENAEDRLPELLKYNEVEGAMFKIKEDPRLTKIGKFIRKRSIDELPQLINVLKGEMSLVGPRPTLPREVMEYSPYDHQRFFVKPGCTGLWQISGRNNLGFKDMIELDIEYIKNQHIFYDLKIIIQTIVVLISLNGAY